MLAAALLVLSVFAVYGSIMGLPYLLTEKNLLREGQHSDWLKYPAVLLGMFLGAKIFFPDRRDHRIRFAHYSLAPTDLGASVF